LEKNGDFDVDQDFERFLMTYSSQGFLKRACKGLIFSFTVNEVTDRQC